MLSVWGTLTSALTDYEEIATVDSQLIPLDATIAILHNSNSNDSVVGHFQLGTTGTIMVRGAIASGVSPRNTTCTYICKS